jgi:hypothetical protein
LDIENIGRKWHKKAPKVEFEELSLMWLELLDGMARQKKWRKWALILQDLPCKPLKSVNLGPSLEAQVVAPIA